ncbi:MAG: pilus assembly protein [Chloroflexota bacterium]
MPPRTASSDGHREEGTASVELIAVVPFLLLAVFVAAQLGAAGGTLWSAGIAARAGARAALVGGDARVAARRALPAALRTGARVERHGGVAVRVAVPRLLPVVPRLRLGAESELDGG